MLTGAVLPAQTVVKMDMAPQAAQKLSVEALFDESIPDGIPVFIDLSGFEVEGGRPPYNYRWILNNEVISQKDYVEFTPKKGDALLLMVTDKNRCRATTSFVLKVAVTPQAGTNAPAEEITIYPTVVTSHVNVRLPGACEGKARIRIYDINGKVVSENDLDGKSTVALNLPKGIYLISVDAGEMHKVERIIVR